MGKPYVMRMADRLLRDFFPPTYRIRDFDAARMKHFASKCERIVVDDVNALLGPERIIGVAWDLIGDLPMAIPPFRDCWMEYATVRDGRLFMFGCCVEHRTRTGPGSFREFGLSDTDTEAARHVVHGTVYRHNGDHITPVGTFNLGFDGDFAGVKVGQPYSAREEWHASINMNLKGKDRAWADANVVVKSLPFMYALSLCNCKGVTVVDGDVFPDARKRIAQKTGKPLLRYKTLNIPTAISEESQRNDGLNTEIVARHSVRGHIKRFGPEAPLFGKYVGNVWCPAHARGDLAAGAVVKDYAVG